LTNIDKLVDERERKKRNEILVCVAFLGFLPYCPPSTKIPLQVPTKPISASREQFEYALETGFEPVTFRLKGALPHWVRGPYPLGRFNNLPACKFAFCPGEVEGHDLFTGCAHCTA
jgi:hypothetical protein